MVATCEMEEDDDIQIVESRGLQQTCAPGDCEAVRKSRAGLQLCEQGLTSSKLIRLGVERSEERSDGSATVRLGTAGGGGAGSVGGGAGGVG